MIVPYKASSKTFIDIVIITRITDSLRSYQVTIEEDSHHGLHIDWLRVVVIAERVVHPLAWDLLGELLWLERVFKKLIVSLPVLDLIVTDVDRTMAITVNNGTKVFSDIWTDGSIGLRWHYESHKEFKIVRGKVIILLSYHIFESDVRTLLLSKSSITSFQLRITFINLSLTLSLVKQ